MVFSSCKHPKTHSTEAHSVEQRSALCQYIKEKQIMNSVIIKFPFCMKNVDAFLEFQDFTNSECTICHDNKKMVLFSCKHANTKIKCWE